MFIKRRAFGFTLIELIIVIFIMMLIVAVATPMLSKFAKRSKVQQATQVLMTAFYHARSESQRFRQMVAVYYGDDLSKCSVKPLAGVLPSRNRVEIWTVKTNGGNNTIGSGGDPLGNMGDWYPYKDPDRDLTPQALTLPEGVSVRAGVFERSWNGSSYDHKFYFNSYNASPIGEIKRHHTVYNRNGCMPGWYDGLNSYFTVLVYDASTGEHSIIWCGDNKSAPRPRVLPYTLTYAYGPSGAGGKLTSMADIPNFIDK